MKEDEKDKSFNESTIVKLNGDFIKGLLFQEVAPESGQAESGFNDRNGLNL